MDTSEFLKTPVKGLKVKSDNTTYLIDTRVDNKRYRKQISAVTLKEATTALNEFVEGIIKQSTLEVDINSTVDTYWKMLRDVKNWKDMHDYKLDSYYKKHIKPILGKMKITDVKPMHFTRFNITINSMSNRSQKKAYEILQPLFSLAIEDELIAITPIKKSHIPVRKQLEEKKIVTDADVKFRYIHQAIWTLFGTDDIFTLNLKDGTTKEIQCNNNPHHLALFLFGFSGRRLSEITSLRWNDIDFIRDAYLVRAENSKVNIDMVFPLPLEIREILSNMDTRSSSKELIFKVKRVDSYYESIREISAIPEFNFHWMRNLVVSALSSQGVDTTYLSAMLGHQDTATLKKYLSLQRTASRDVINKATEYLLEWE